MYKQVACFGGVVGFSSSHWLWLRGKMNCFDKAATAYTRNVSSHLVLVLSEKSKLSRYLLHPDTFLLAIEKRGFCGGLKPKVVIDKFTAL